MSALGTTSVRRTLIVLGVLIALFAAFESYAWTTRHRGLHLSRGGSSFALVPSTATPSATASAAAGDDAAVPTPSSTPSLDGTAATTTTNASAAPVPATRSRGVQGSSSSHAAAVTTPRTGVYRLAVDGKEKVDFGPVSFCSRSLPASTTLVVAPAAGEAPGSFDFDVRYFPGSAGQHDERHIYRYTGATVLLDYENATVTCGGVQQSSEVSYAPPQVRVRLPLHVGAQWSSTGGDANRTEDATSKVLRTETLRLVGADVATYVIETKVSISGSETGSRLQRWWYAPSLAIPVKWFEHIDGSRSGATYSEDATVTVVSTP